MKLRHLTYIHTMIMLPTSIALQKIIFPYQIWIVFFSIISKYGWPLYRLAEFIERYIKFSAK